jgi:translocation and assembly module TamB
LHWQTWPTVTLSHLIHLCNVRDYDEDCEPRIVPVVSEVPYQLAGDLIIDRFRYTKEMEPKKALLDFIGGRRVDSTLAAKAKPQLRLNVTVKADRSIDIDNNLAHVRLSGKARLIGNDTRTGLIGELTAPEGGRGYYQGNELEITSAVVQFQDRDQIVPRFDVNAETVVREYRIHVRAWGTPAEYTVDYTSDPSLPRGDIISLFLVGATNRDRNAAPAAGLRAASDLLLSLSGLDKKARDFLPDNPLVSNLRTDFSSRYSSITGQVEPTAGFSVNVLTKDLTARFAQPVNEVRGQQASVEYVLGATERGGSALQLSWDNDVATTTMGGNLPIGNLGLDLKLHFRRR